MQGPAYLDVRAWKQTASHEAQEVLVFAFQFGLIMVPTAHK